METDRYEKNRSMFVLGLLSLMVCLALLFFALFMLPHLLLGWHYHVPEFIAFWREGLVRQFGLTVSAASQLILLFLTTGAFAAGIIAYIASTRIENQIYLTEPVVTVKKTEKGHLLKESLPSFFNVLGIVFLVAVVLFLLHWLISTPDI